MTPCNDNTTPYQHGLCDALANRACVSPWKDFKRRTAYLKGYLDGIELKIAS
jgi:hypothetical protein